MNNLAKYDVDGQELTVTADDVRNLLCPNATEKEIALLLELCKAQKLNPFTGEVYLIKYSDKPATIVVGKDVFTKRAARNPKFRGYSAGVTIKDSEGRVSKRKGSMRLNGETIVGGWCEVHVEGYECPMFDEVSFNEYAAKQRNGNLNSNWMNKPGTMIRKVAIVHALREAFPEDFQGMYDEAEMAPSEAIREPITTITEPTITEPINTEPVDAEPIDEFAQIWEEIRSAKQRALDCSGNPEKAQKGIDEFIAAAFGDKRRDAYTMEECQKLQKHLIEMRQSYTEYPLSQVTEEAF